MPVQHLYTLLCDYAFKDGGSEKYGFLGTFQNIDLDRFPGAIPQFFIVVGVIAEAGDQLAIIVANADRSWQTNVGAGTVQDSPMLQNRERVAVALTILCLQGLEFPAPGGYQILLLAGEQVIHSCPFRVNLKVNQDGDRAA
jgi:hypothetical protein